MKLEGSVVIVTGASAGIGKATAKLLAARGANLVLTARREDRLKRLAEELEAHHVEILPVPGDIRDEAFAPELLASTLARFERVDVLVNNAGLGHRNWLAEMPPADMRTIIDTNVMGMLYVTQAAVQQMKKQRSGHIINISSIAGQVPLANSAVYCASKSAVNFISRSLRAELRPHHISVTLVYPGRTLTEFSDARLGGKGVSRSPLFRVSAGRVGKAIVKAIETGRKEVHVTWYDWLVTYFGRHFPRTTDWVIGLVIKVP